MKQNYYSFWQKFSELLWEVLGATLQFNGREEDKRGLECIDLRPEKLIYALYKNSYGRRALYDGRFFGRGSIRCGPPPSF